MMGLIANLYQVAGVDGCPSGWVVAMGSDVDVVPTFADVLAATRDAVCVAVDMPIGLPDAGARACDVAARVALGPRRSSVFPAPRRALLRCREWADATGVSRQTFNLLPR